MHQAHLNRLNAEPRSYQLSYMKTTKMPRFKVGDMLRLQGQLAKVVWFSENANEIEELDEYIVEFQNKKRQFFLAAELFTLEKDPIRG